MHIDKITNGVEVPLPPAEFKEGVTTLREVLAVYGAPAEVVDMKGRFALHYQRTLDRAAHISAGLPLGEAVKMGPKMSARGSLLRHDSLVFVFTREGLLEGMIHQKGTDQPGWGTFWR